MTAGSLPVPSGRSALPPKLIAGLMAAVANRSAYQGASTQNANFGTWQPRLASADAEILHDAPTIRARARDLVRNNPTARQAVRVSRQGTIGAHFRLVLRPDYEFLGLEHDDVVPWARMAERVWEQYAHGTGCWLDAGRRFSFTELMALAHDSDFVDGECLVAAEWRDDGTPWQTCFQVVDVDRLSNPYGWPDSIALRGGVALDRFGAPTGYHIRQAHPGDIGIVGMRPWIWEMVPRETPWFRPIVMHSFDPVRAGQSRGVSEFASVIQALKMGKEYAEAELANAVVRAGFVAVLTSAMNFEKAAEALGQGGWDPSAVDEHGNAIADPLTALAFANLEQTAAYYNELNLTVNGQKIPKLSPGDDLKFLGENTPGSGYAAYVRSQILNVAAGLGVDPVGISQDFSNVNYSSAKMAWSVNGGHAESRRARLVRMLAMPIVGAWMEEAVQSGRLPMPKGFAPDDFYVVRDALVRGTFLCAGKPTLDPLKEAQANQIALGYGGKTLEELCAEDGTTVEERLTQIARENHQRERLGLMPVGALPPAPLDTDDDEQPDTGESGGGGGNGQD